MPLRITNPKNLIFTVNELVNYKFIAKGGVKPYKWKSKLPLPSGLILTKKGILKGMVTETMVYLQRPIKVIDSNGNAKSKTFILRFLSPTTTPEPTTTQEPTTTTTTTTTTTPIPALNVSDVYVGVYSGITPGIFIYNRNANSGLLTYTGINITTLVTELCMSEDESTIYALKNDPYGQINTYSRNLLTGELTSVNLIENVEPFDIVISSDDSSVYVLEDNNQQIRGFVRNTSTGILTQNGVYSTDNIPCGFCITSDGKNVYVTHGSRIKIFDRNIYTGVLTPNSTLVTNRPSLSICVSADGSSVYVTTDTQYAEIYIYSRDTSTGILTSNGSVGTNGAVSGKIYISQDGLNVYYLNDIGISNYDRNPFTGALTANGIFGNIYPYRMCILKDNTNVYVTYSSPTNKIQSFNRNILTGQLTFSGEIALQYPNGIAIPSNRLPSGSLWNWGGNIIGEIGDNTTNSKSSPVQTISYGTNWMKISYESNHIASIKTDGTLWLWGYNAYGQLGDNTNTNRSSPIQTIAYGTNWKQVSCGQKHTAAIKTDGTLWTWGINNFGCLGDNTVTTRSSPVQTVTFGNNWMQVCCGYSITAAIKTDGTLWLWGKNSNGQLGDNTILPKSSPIQTITYGSNWKQIALSSTFADQNYCGAVKNDGTLWMWGWNISGNLGDNTTVSKSSPIQTISYGTNWKQIDIGANFTGAIKNDGTLWLWGQNVYGELGDNTAIQRSSPVQTITYSTNWKKVVCGSNISAAIKTDGTLWCWGSNGGGQLGDNTIISKSSPVQTVSGGTNWIDVACGSYNVSGIKS